MSETPPYQHRYPLVPLPLLLDVIEKASENRKNCTDIVSIFKEHTVVIALWLEGDDFDDEGTLLLPTPADKRTGPVLAAQLAKGPKKFGWDVDKVLEALRTTKSMKWTAVWVKLSDAALDLPFSAIKIQKGEPTPAIDEYRTDVLFPNDPRRRRR